MKITVVTKKPNEKPEIVEIENEIHAYQSYIGGYIECYEVINGVNFIINEDGEYLHLIPNIVCPEFDAFFVGNIIAAGVDFDERCFVSLTDEQVHKVLEYFALNSIVDGKIVRKF